MGSHERAVMSLKSRAVKHAIKKEKSSKMHSVVLLCCYILLHSRMRQSLFFASRPYYVQQANEFDQEIPLSHTANQHTAL